MWFYFSFRRLKCKVREKSGVLPNSLSWKISESLQLFYFHKTNVLLNNLSKRFNQKVGIKYWFSNPIYQISWLKTHIICIGEPELIVVQRRQQFFYHKSCNWLFASLLFKRPRIVSSLHMIACPSDTTIFTCYWTNKMFLWIEMYSF